MTLNTSILTSHMCGECGLGSGFDATGIERLIADIGEMNFLSEIIECSGCGNKFERYKGIIEEFISDNIYAILPTIYDVIYDGVADITVGKEYKVVLPKKFLINRVHLGNKGAGASIGPNFYTELEANWFTIASCECENISGEGHYKRIGDSHQVFWKVYGKSGNKPSETWLLLLAQIKEQILHGQYNIAILTSEMMFESFLDQSLKKMLISEGLSEEASYTILESMRSIYDKAHKLLKNLNGAGLSSNKAINKQWKDLMELRNKIAHGENIDVDKEKAQWGLRTALDAIFYIYMNSSTDIN
ncbi:hypothetical protein [Priestia megaterium]|uniref:hypothetical protein n=1 Tax=Priestia megaterium TaxID=1404 RepID=UPI000BF93C93|nr:hypothetical protein [Priestia megaterium]PFJ03212.1 hypothetical protein COI84_02675 [Priestia megaterium]PGR11747.1 hypothetical protein COC62_14080 [Priestia megaterium]